MRTSRACSLKTPLDAEWLQLLDVESFDFEDPLAHHLLWCSDVNYAISRRGEVVDRAALEHIGRAV
jgi:hypothetical protein